MVTDVLQSGRPDPGFTKQVIEEATRRADDARKAHATADALRHYNDALAALDDLPAGAEQQRLRMDLLWKKGGASEFSPGWPEAVKLYEQALALARDLGDKPLQATMLAHIGVTRSNMGERDAARDAYTAALDLYRSLGDKSGQGMTSFWIASLHLADKRPADARPLLKKALALLDAAGSHELAAVCRAALDLVRQVPARRFPSRARQGPHARLPDHRTPGEDISRPIPSNASLRVFAGDRYGKPRRVSGRQRQPRWASSSDGGCPGRALGRFGTWAAI